MTSRLFTRRHLLAGGAGLATLSLAGLPAIPAFAADDLAATAEAAAIWGFPLVLTGRYLGLSQQRGIAFNQFYLNPKLATPSLKVAGPNVDTIYGFAWLDVTHEPVVLDVPDTGDRYYSIQLIDAYANTFDYVGRRQTGTKAGTFVVAGPDWSGTKEGALPAGAQLVRAPTGLVLALTRTLVRGDADAPVAADVQLHYTLSPLSAWPAGRKAGIVQADVLNILPALDLSQAGAGYFDELDRLVRAYPPTGPEAQTFARFSALGLGTDRFAAQKPDPAVLAAAFTRAYARIRAYSDAEVVNGWRVDRHIAPFIADPLARAAVNRFGPGAHIAQEALYFSAVGDADGQPLSGANRYTLTFPAGGLPPVDAFWSLILYGPDFFLVDNPLNRYAINDRTPGLVKAADGSLTLSIQHDRPADAANWLPAPDGKFQLIFRTYQPRPAVLDGSYKLPPLRKV